MRCRPMPTAAAVSGLHRGRESVPYRTPSLAVRRDCAASYRLTLSRTLIAHSAFVKCVPVRLRTFQDCKDGDGSGTAQCNPSISLLSWHMVDHASEEELSIMHAVYYCICNK